MVLVDRLVGNPALPVLEADGIHEDEALHAVGIQEREPDAEHASHGVADHGRCLDAELVQERAREVGQLLEGVLEPPRLRRLAEPDLVRRDHAIAGGGEGADGGCPVGAGEVLAVQQHDRVTVGLGRGHVHVGHVQPVLLGLDGHRLDREGIGVLREARIVGGGGGAGGRRSGRDRRRGEQRKDDHAGEGLHVGLLAPV